MITKRYHKKAHSFPMEMIIKMLLAVVGFFFIIVLIYKIFTGLQAESIEQACRASVIAKVKFRDVADATAGNIGESFVNRAYPVQCITQRKDIPEKKTRTMGDEEIRDQTLKEIADMTVSCWWMFANGNYHQIFADAGINSNKCHICYKFVINPLDALTQQALTKQDLIEYMSTHKYDPGLIRGGGALTAVNAIYEYEPQNVKTSSRESRQITEERLMASSKRLDKGIADFTNTFEGQETKLKTLQDKLIDIYNLKIEPVIIIIPELPSEYDERHVEDADLAMKLLEDWQIGDSDLNNGMVFLFSLNDGVLHYAADIGAHAVLSQGQLEEQVINVVIDEHLQKDTMTTPADAIIAFIDELYTTLKGENNILETLELQGTYLAYISGGKVGATNSNTLLKAAGTLLVKDDFDEDEKTGEQDENGERFEPRVSYSIAYVSPKWDTNVPFIGDVINEWNLCLPFSSISEKNCLGEMIGSATIPNAIAVGLTQEFNSYGAQCDVIEQD